MASERRPDQRIPTLRGVELGAQCILVAQLVDSGYLLASIEDPSSLKDRFAHRFADSNLLGTLIIAPEGLNWSLYGEEACLDQCVSLLGDMKRIGELRHTRTKSHSIPFTKLKLRSQPELVTSGLDLGELPPARGVHVAPEDFNALLDAPGMRCIDLRNDYEITIGTFTQAEDPQIKNFVDFPQFVKTKLESGDKSAPVALCCTGGIRCERASQYLLSRGFERVYQLSGGILAYLHSIPSEDRRFEGECFVFDGRVSVTADLEQGSYKLNGASIEPSD